MKETRIGVQIPIYCSVCGSRFRIGDKILMYCVAVIEEESIIHHYCEECAKREKPELIKGAGE